MAILTVCADGILVAVFVTICARLRQAAIRLPATLCNLFQNKRIDDILFCVACAAFDRGMLSGTNEARQVVVERFLVKRRKKIVPPLMLPVARDALLSRDLEMIPPPFGEGSLNLRVAYEALFSCYLVRCVVALQTVIHPVELVVGERQFSRGKLGRRDLCHAKSDEQ